METRTKFSEYDAGGDGDAYYYDRRNYTGK